MPQSRNMEEKDMDTTKNAKSVTLLDHLMECVGIERKSLTSFQNESVIALHNLQYAGTHEGMFFALRRELADSKKVEIYKVPSDLNLPELKSLGKVLKNQNFNRSWIMQFIPSHENELEEVVAHVTFDEGKTHIIMRSWFTESRESVNLSFCTISDGKLTTHGDDEEDVMCWIMQLFLAMESRQFIDVVEIDRHQNSNINFNCSNISVFDISLNEAGLRSALLNVPVANI